MAPRRDVRSAQRAVERAAAGRLLRIVRCLLVVAALVGAPNARAELPLWRPVVQSDPLEFGSLRLEPAFANVPPNGEWYVSFTATEFNLWTHTWHTFAAHRETNRYRLDLTAEELRGIEANFPQDAAWHLDVEGWRSDLILTRGLSGGRSVSVKIPYVEIGSPHWDGLGEWFHTELGISSLEREVFPRNDTFIYIKDKDNDAIVEARRELEGAGLGDVSAAISLPLRSRWGASQRLVAALEFPTGERGTLWGSGGVDANLSWFAMWFLPKQNLTLAAGYTFLDPRGDFIGIERAQHLGHVSFGVDQPLWRSLWATFAVRLDASPLWSVTHDHPGRPATFYRLGLMADAGRAGWIGFDVGEELRVQTGVESDWSFHVTWGSMLR